jgi:hypothetical protein
MALRSVWLLLSLAVTVSVAAACTHEVTKEVDDPSADDDDDDDTTSKPPDDSGLGVLTFRPSTMYSGFDGTHAFKVPFAVYDYDDDVKVTASPAGAVTLTEQTLANPTGPNGTDKGKYYFAQTKAAGDVTLTVTSKGRTASGVLHVAQYDAASWSAGEARYTTASGPPDNDPPCTQCHAGASGIDHSPAALATVKDEDVGRIITTGISTGGFPIKINGQAGHKWQVKDDSEKLGLITYLRALEPKGFK